MYRNERKLKQATVKWLPVTALLLLASTSSVAQQDDASAYRMAVIKDDAYGRMLMSGDYDEGIVKIGSYNRKRAKSFSAQNNLCVAYTLTRRYEEAAPACEAALSISERDAREGYTPFRSQSTRDQALAYSNRGVLKAVTGDFDGAKQDFESAAAANDKIDATANLRWLESRRSQAASASTR